MSTTLRAGNGPAPLPPVAHEAPVRERPRSAEAPTSFVDVLDWLNELSREHLDAESDLSVRMAETLDRSVASVASRFTLGLSPLALAEAYFAWITHVAASPGKRAQLVEKAARKFARLLHYGATCALTSPERQCIAPLPNDKRFQDAAWRQWPFNVIHQAFLLQQQWWHNATTGVTGVSHEHEQQVAFATRQVLDMLSPANFVLTNPVVLEQTLRETGQNLVRGCWNFLMDWERTVNGRAPAGAEMFRVGVEVAATPGRVIYRNRLIELIQYEPTTRDVRPEPVLIVPAWIMKYYILDLSPRNSLVKHLVDQGFTVFMISWRNPRREDRDIGMEDYLTFGIEASLAAIRDLLPGSKVHGVGYCLGGTLLSIAAAALARDGRSDLASLTLFAAQVDFEEAGELTLFINEAQVAFLENMMWEQGYLDTHQMAGAFQMIRSNDLIWSRVLHSYLMGERREMTDLMAWNADGTRLPYRMHSQYLRQLFLDNDLAEGRYAVGGRPVALTAISCPVFAVATVNDHVAPWRSIYKLHLLLDTELTFLLTTGGHNAGILSEPGSTKREYRVREHVEGQMYLDPDAWLHETRSTPGSWWPEWWAWLHARSSPFVVPSRVRRPGSVELGSAPGTYVLAA